MDTTRHFEDPNHAKVYGVYRPRYPQEVFDNIIKFVRKKVSYVILSFIKNCIYYL